MFHMKHQNKANKKDVSRETNFGKNEEDYAGKQDSFFLSPEICDIIKLKQRIC